MPVTIAHAHRLLGKPMSLELPQLALGHLLNDSSEIFEALAKCARGGPSGAGRNNEWGACSGMPPANFTARESSS